MQSKLFFSEEQDENRNTASKDWLDFEVFENVFSYFTVNII